jgi:type I restriction enzyme, S subunit
VANSWPVISLGDVAEDITVGHVGPMMSEYRSHGVPFLRSKDIEPFRVNTSEITYISEAFHHKLKKSALHPGDVVIVRTGKPGTAAAIPENLLVANCSDLVIVRPGTKLDARFLVYYVNGLGNRHVASHLVGAVQQHFNVGSARQFRIALPSPAEQRAIGRALGDLDNKIELNRRMNNTLEAVGRAIFRSWFITFDALRLGVSQLTASELGLIPSFCRVAQLGEIAEVVDCLHSKKPQRQQTGKPLLQLSNIRNDGLLDIADTYLISEQDYELWISRMEASQGDCVITNVGRVAAVAQIPTGLMAALGRNMTGVRCRVSYPYPSFLVQLLMSESMKEEVGLKTDSGTILESLNVRSIPRLRFVLPPTERLQAFEHLCRPLRAKMEENLKESRALTKLRDILLPKLISGEIRIKEAEKSIGALV